MGCAASADGDLPKKDAAGGQAPNSKAVHAAGKSSYANRRNGGEEGNDDRQPHTPIHAAGSSTSRPELHNSSNLLTQSLLSDLRLRNSKEGPGVNRWVEGIVPPCDEDNVDLYDPLRRHKLAMESISARLKKPGAAISSSQSNNGGGSATSKSKQKSLSETSNGSQHGTEDNATTLGGETATAPETATVHDEQRVAQRSPREQPPLQ